ncbi:hypothetical protein [Fodinibius salsisoli]|uniref:DUF4136 domain-containing protein n=1 Tax=Fodinibius salsisoli TaxID=2820877 RepID=A0ABT3PNZ4_9BACT|nr:hypothetical protein [Fodinibius salsisoli]MCW9707568.1 hypothetical protein [Fodinibius salsisoli]
MDYRLSSRLVVAFFLSLLVSACATTQSAVDPNIPHTYSNSFEEVINASQEALANAGMKILKSKQIDQNNYHYHYFKTRYDVAGNNNSEGGLGADLNITKISDNITKVVIKEETQSGLVPGSHKENLGKDLLRELNKLLNHNSQDQNS